eukprot:3558625-Rhodomonas_salina.1
MRAGSGYPGTAGRNSYPGTRGRFSPQLARYLQQRCNKLLQYNTAQKTRKALKSKIGDDSTRYPRCRHDRAIPLCTPDMVVARDPPMSEDWFIPGYPAFNVDGYGYSGTRKQTNQQHDIWFETLRVCVSTARLDVVNKDSNGKGCKLKN